MEQRTSAASSKWAADQPSGGTNCPPPGTVIRPPWSTSTAYSSVFALTGTIGTLAGTAPSGPGPRVRRDEAQDTDRGRVLRPDLRRARRRAREFRSADAAARPA